MKSIHVLFIGLAAAVTMASCSDKDRYVDLRTGKTVEIEKDPQGIWVDVGTKKPVYIYVDTKKHDTIYGKTGAVINGHIVKGGDNVYWYDEDAKNNGSSESAEMKKKVEDDGDTKIKTDDKKIKIDGETGEKKVKKD